MPRPSGGTVKAVRSLLDDPRVFDAVIVLLATWFLLSAYVVAWAYVITAQGVPSAASAGASGRLRRNPGGRSRIRCGVDR